MSGPSEDQLSLVALADDILRARTGNDQLAALERSGSTVDDVLWRELADAGVTGIAVPEQYGGAGLGLTELCLVLEQVGRRLAPVPLWETAVLGALTVSRFGTAEQQARWLPGVADGSVRLSASVDLVGASPSVTARGAVLSGTALLVPHGDTADAVVVAAGAADGTAGLFLVPTDGLTRTSVRTTNHELAADILLDGVVAEPLGDAAAVDWLTSRARVGLAALQLGVADEGVREAAAYLTGREQFGRPLATFQAVTQQLGDAYCDVQAMRATLWQAVHVLERADAGGPGAPATTTATAPAPATATAATATTAAAVGVASWWATDAADRVQHTVQHVHGGMGADTTYPVHRRLLWTMRSGAQLGGASRQLERLGHAVLQV